MIFSPVIFVPKKKRKEGRGEGGGRYRGREGGKEGRREGGKEGENWKRGRLEGSCLNIY